MVLIEGGNSSQNHLSILDSEHEIRLLQDREDQGVQTPFSYCSSMNKADIQDQETIEIVESIDNVSLFKLFQALIHDF